MSGTTVLGSGDWLVHLRELPVERVAKTHKFSVEGQEGYVTVGMYEDGKPGELFITMAKEGSTLAGMVDAFATAISLTLQCGVSLEFLVSKFSHVRFEPSGWTNNPQIPYAKSIIDYVFRWLASKFLWPSNKSLSASSRCPPTRVRRPRRRSPLLKSLFSPLSFRWWSIPAKARPRRRRRSR
jgi:ribonucleoside-diphosphate reductase alpha chain